MRMTHFALALTLVLLAITGYLAWEGQVAAQGARKELQFFKEHKEAQETARPSERARVPLPAAPAPVAATAPAPAPVAAIPPVARATASITDPLPGSGAPAAAAFPEMAGAGSLPGGGLTVPKSVMAAEASGISTNMLTPVQKQVLAAKPVAKVKTVVKDQGFIVIDSGSKQDIKKGMKLDIRRGGAVLGRALVTDSVEESESVADLDIASIPTGVTIEPGDELIAPVGANR